MAKTEHTEHTGQPPLRMTALEDFPLTIDVPTLHCSRAGIDGARIVVAMPTRGRPMSIAQSRAEEIASHASRKLWVICGEPVTLVRNCIASRFLDNSNGTHLLMIDDDTVPALPETALRLAALDAPIATGITPMLVNERVEFNVWRNGYWEPPWPHGTFEVEACGTSCLMIRREVLEALEFPWFQFQQNRSNHLRSEDVSFCRRARDAGYKIMCDANVICSHWHEVDLLRLIGPPPTPQSIADRERFAQIEQECANALVG